MADELSVRDRCFPKWSYEVINTYLPQIELQMQALMSLNANKIYLDYHLGSEIQCICRVNKNKQLIKVIWDLYLIGFNFGDTIISIKMSAVEFNQPIEPHISHYIITALRKPLKEGRKLWAFDFNLTK